MSYKNTYCQNTEVNEMCSIKGTLCDVWATKILSQDLNMFMEVM